MRVFTPFRVVASSRSVRGGCSARRAARASPVIGGSAMYARSTTVQGDPQAMDDAIAYVRDEVAPLVGDMDGYVGISMICDRDSGRCIITSTWATEEARQSSAASVVASRSRVAEILRADTPVVRDWEVAA